MNETRAVAAESRLAGLASAVQLRMTTGDRLRFRERCVRVQFVHKRLGPRLIWKRYPLVNGPPREPLITAADRYADFSRRERVCRLLTSNNLGS